MGWGGGAWGGGSAGGTVLAGNGVAKEFRSRLNWIGQYLHGGVTASVAHVVLPVSASGGRPATARSPRRAPTAVLVPAGPFAYGVHMASRLAATGYVFSASSEGRGREDAGSCLVFASPRLSEQRHLLKGPGLLTRRSGFVVLSLASCHLMCVRVLLWNVAVALVL